MMDSVAYFGVQILQIVWLDLLLSGDNAVVIALACRALPPEQRRLGILLGGGAAVALRIVFTVAVVTLLNVPYLKLIGGILLLWIGVKLIIDESDETSISESDTVWNAVRTIALADMVMSLDNVIAIAAAARGSVALIVFGLVLSVPLIVFGATLIIRLLHRFPLLVWAGAGLLGWVAGGLIVTDPGWSAAVNGQSLLVDETLAGLAGAGIVVAVAWSVRRYRAGARH